MQQPFLRCVLWMTVVSALGYLGGCNSATQPDSEAAARKWMTAELDKWVAGGESKANTFSFQIKFHQPPLSYQIRTLAPVQVSVPLTVLDKHKEIPATLPGFRVIVDLDFRSEADTVIKKVGEYQLVWVEPDRTWYLEENM